MDAQSLPIDIHYNKLLDWLIDRRHCDLRWHHQLQEIKTKAKRGLSSLPKDESTMAPYLEKEEISYCDCVDVMKHLMSVESKERNFLGQYTSPVLKEWEDILKSYEKKNLHLAEGAHLMTRLVNYEIASLKRQITRCQQQQKESARKVNDNQVSARSLQAKFEEQCNELGIEGKDLYHELSMLLSDQLPVLFDETASLALSLQPAVDYYQAFRNCTVVSRSSSNVLSLLKFFMKNGNVTVYQWENEEPPQITESVTASSSDEVPVPKENQELEIDWGDFGGAEEIDYGGDSGEIDYDISLDQLDLTGITIEDGGDVTSSYSTSVSKYPTLLEDCTTRNLLLDDLMELSAFIKQRISELSAENGGLLLQVELPSSVQGYSSQDVREMLDNVTAVIGKLTNKRIQQLLLMLGSRSYMERLSSQLLHQQELSRRAASLAIDHTHKIKECGEQQLQLEKSLALLVKETKRIKSMVAQEISKKYSNRNVNIMGEISQIQ